MSERIHLGGRQVLALTALMILAYSGALGMPFNINAIAVSFPVGNTGAGNLATAELLAIAFGTLGIGRVARGVSAVRIYAVTLTTIVVTNALSVAAANIWMLGLLRVPSGLALGAVVATVMATAARSDRPESTFGTINASVGAMGIVISFVLPRALHLQSLLGLRTSIAALYVIYALLSACAFAFLRLVPVAPALAVPAVGSAPVRLPLPRWLGLFGLGLLFFGHALLGMFIVNLGIHIGMSAENVGYVFMAGAVLGIAGPLFAGQVGGRVSARGWVASFAIAIVMCAFVMATLTSEVGYWIVVPLYGVLPMTLYPVYLGALARSDVTGRLASSNSAFILLGSALSPFLGGYLSDAGGYIANAGGVAICALTGLALMWADLQRADAIRGATAAASLAH